MGQPQPAGDLAKGNPATSLLTLPLEIRLQIYSLIYTIPTDYPLIRIYKNRGLSKYNAISTPFQPRPSPAPKSDRDGSQPNQPPTSPPPPRPLAPDPYPTALQLTSRQLHCETSHYQYAFHAWSIAPQRSTLAMPGPRSATRRPLPGTVAQLDALVSRIGARHAAAIEEVHVDLLAPVAAGWNGGDGLGQGFVDLMVSRELRPFGRRFKQVFRGLKRLVIVAPTACGEGMWWRWYEGRPVPAATYGPGLDEELTEGGSGVGDGVRLWGYMRDMFFDWVREMPLLHNVALDFSPRWDAFHFPSPMVRLLATCIAMVDKKFHPSPDSPWQEPKFESKDWVVWHIPGRLRDGETPFIPHEEVKAEAYGEGLVEGALEAFFGGSDDWESESEGSITESEFDQHSTT